MYDLAKAYTHVATPFVHLCLDLHCVPYTLTCVTCLYYGTCTGTCTVHAANVVHVVYMLRVAIPLYQRVHVYIDYAVDT